MNKYISRKANNLRKYTEMRLISNSSCGILENSEGSEGSEVFCSKLIHLLVFFPVSSCI